MAERRRRVRGSSESKRESNSSYEDSTASAETEDSFDDQLRHASKVTQISHAAIYPDRVTDVDTENFLATHMARIAENCVKGLESRAVVKPVSTGGVEGKIVIRGVGNPAELERLLKRQLENACKVDTDDDVRTGLRSKLRICSRRAHTMF